MPKAKTLRSGIKREPGPVGQGGRGAPIFAPETSSGFLGFSRKVEYDYLTGLPRKASLGDAAQLARDANFPRQDSGIPMMPIEHIIGVHRRLISSVCLSLGTLNQNEFLTYVVPVIWGFADVVHLLPASQDYHHSEQGGAFRHGLEVAYHALDIFKSKQLIQTLDIPPGDFAEANKRWGFALLAGALLHDIGKPLTDVFVYPTTGQTNEKWNPATEGILEWGKRQRCDRYFVTWREGRKRHHEHDAMFFYHHLINQQTQRWFMEVTWEPFEHLRRFLKGDGWNDVIGRTISEADSRSTERDLSKRRELGQTSLRHYRPVERMLHAMRSLTRRGLWKVNESGARVYVDRKDPKYVYVVWLPAAKDIVAEVRHDNHDLIPIPQAPDDIADFLIDEGVAVRCEVEGGSHRYHIIEIPSYSALLSGNKISAASALKVERDVIFDTPPPCQPMDLVIFDRQAMDDEMRRNPSASEKDILRAGLPRKEEKPQDEEISRIIERPTPRVVDESPPSPRDESADVVPFPEVPASAEPEPAPAKQIPAQTDPVRPQARNEKPAEPKAPSKQSVADAVTKPAPAKPTVSTPAPKPETGEPVQRPSAATPAVDPSPAPAKAKPKPAAPARTTKSRRDEEQLDLPIDEPPVEDQSQPAEPQPPAEPDASPVANSGQSVEAPDSALEEVEAPPAEPEIPAELIVHKGHWLVPIPVAEDRSGLKGKTLLETLVAAKLIQEKPIVSTAGGAMVMAEGKACFALDAKDVATAITALEQLSELSPPASQSKQAPAKDARKGQPGTQKQQQPKKSRNKKQKATPPASNKNTGNKNRQDTSSPAENRESPGSRKSETVSSGAAEPTVERPPTNYGEDGDLSSGEAPTRRVPTPTAKQANDRDDRDAQNMKAAAAFAIYLKDSVGSGTVGKTDDGRITFKMADIRTFLQAHPALEVNHFQFRTYLTATAKEFSIDGVDWFYREN